MHRILVVIGLVLALTSISAQATSRSYVECSRNFEKLRDSTPHYALWMATSLSSLGSLVAYGTEALVQDRGGPIEPAMVLLGYTYIFGFFMGPDPCDEVEGKKREGQLGGATFGKVYVDIPEDPRAYHRSATTTALVYSGLGLGLQTWLAVSATSTLGTVAIATMAAVTPIVAIVNREKFEYKPAAEEGPKAGLLFTPDGTPGLALSWRL